MYVYAVSVVAAWLELLMCQEGMNRALQDHGAVLGRQSQALRPARDDLSRQPIDIAHVQYT